MNVEDSLVLMADTIYGCDTGVVMPIPKLQMSLRSQDQFMGESYLGNLAKSQICPWTLLPHTSSQFVILRPPITLA